MRYGTSNRPRLLCVATHPIQYQAPWFRALSQSHDIDSSVLFVQQLDSAQQGTGFGHAFQWDVPLLEGYAHGFARELAGPGGVHGYFAARLKQPVRELAEARPDAVLLTGWHAWPLVQLLATAWWKRKPVIMRGEANALRPRPWHVRLLHRAILGRCRAFLCIGQSNRDFYRRYGIDDDRLFDAPYFVDNQRFMRQAADLASHRDELRAAWGIDTDAFCFCYAGKLEPKKRILDLLEALRIGRDRTQARMHLLVVGTGELQQQAQDFARQHRLPVTFAGFLNQTEIARAYVAADALVLPSDFGETWGLVVNEAMACGRPAIVSDRVGCGPDLVHEGLTGSTFSFGDCEALASKLVQFAENPVGARAMGAAAQARVLEHFSVEKSVAGTVAAVRFALGR